MPEVQKHGFIWQDDISRNVYGATSEELKKIKYNAKMDLPANLNRLNPTCDVNIKTSQTPNNVCTGSALEFYESVFSGKQLHIVVIFYTQDKELNIKKFHSVIEIDLTSMGPTLFGSLSKKDIEDLDAEVKKVPNKRKPTKEEHKAMFDLRDKLMPKFGDIYLNIKCDSEQSRLQSSFNQFKNFITKNPDRIIAKSSTTNFRGGNILAIIQSPPRKRKTKEEKEEARKQKEAAKEAKAAEKEAKAAAKKAAKEAKSTK